MHSSGTLSGEHTAYAFCTALLGEVHDNPDYGDSICGFETDQMTWWYDPELHEEGWECPDCGTVHTRYWDRDAGKAALDLILDVVGWTFGLIAAAGIVVMILAQVGRLV